MSKKKIINLKWIDPFSVAKFTGLFNFIMGILIALYVTLSGHNEFLPPSTPTGIFGMIWIPLSYGVGGFAFGWLIIMIYNTINKKYSSIRIRGMG